ncbi:MAG: DUF4129 domain-containing protein [Treponema sp.]|nr:DUF4129 domain-containing protein [Treponema sp.]
MNFFSESALHLRRRGLWEAADSGVLLWRSNAVHFIPFFAIPFWIIACGLRLFPEAYSAYSYLILWWLKPLFDRLVLHVVARRFFGLPGIEEKRSLSRGLGRSLWRGLAGDLSWRRFSPNRAAHMPIRLLEEIRPREIRSRKKALAPGGLNFCFLITILCLLMEGMLLFGEIIFSIMMIQIIVPSAFEYFQYGFQNAEIFIFAAYCLNYFLVESLYVCMGFGLYINSRVEVEGWDLQILFQKLAARGPKKGPLLSVLVLAFLLLGAPALSSSEEAERPHIEYFSEDFPLLSEEQGEALIEILSSSDFGGTRESWGIRLRHEIEEPEPLEEELVDWLMRLRQIFAHVLRYMIILGALVFVGFLIYWLRRSYAGSSRSKKGRGYRVHQNPLMSSESPESLFAIAEISFREGRIREAWAACLSGCLGAFSLYHSLSFPPHATEYGCLHLVRQAQGQAAPPFEDLVRSWIYFAYGERPPAQGAFERALAFGRSLLEEGRDEP